MDFLANSNFTFSNLHSLFDQIPILTMDLLTWKETIYAGKAVLWFWEVYFPSLAYLGIFYCDPL
jgi:hypothetical protein